MLKNILKKMFTSGSAVLVAIVFAFLSGYLVKGMLGEPVSSVAAGAGEAKEIWTCSMHPQIQRFKPGICPLCPMDLIPLSSMGVSGDGGQISFSPAALKLMELQTAPVERKIVEAEIRTVGKIDFDETRLKNVTAWVAGRIDRMYVDFTGTRVVKGDHMFDLYSPDLINTQTEYLLALKAAARISAQSSDLIRRSTQATLEAARQKMKLLGLTDKQIETLKSSGQTQDHVTIYAPQAGIVIKKHVHEGAYVKEGSPIYTVADLSTLWVNLDAYESDMVWIRYGQPVEFTVEGWPGKVFAGKISFIAPTVDPKMRTIKLRVNVDNQKGMLKPQMFVKAIIRPKIAADKVAADASLIGKWICPMHPSVVESDKTICDKCQMDLVTVESLGYAAIDVDQAAPLVIPATAPLITGKRAVVYVSVPGGEKPTFVGRNVVLGPRAGDYYLVQGGLKEGEMVVVNGNFKIDSALQIQAQPSMMSPAEPAATSNGKQLTCPVMGGKVDEKYFIEYQGKKVYFCCPGCEDSFLKDPDKYLGKLPQFNKNPN